jgi:hypothetical protein
MFLLEASHYEPSFGAMLGQAVVVMLARMLGKMLKHR